ncbi:MAG: hypothetical protein BGP06_02070 [Rhizobiales bacterium 65-9]|nr:MAG: hypothetical protein BGP06_02070 [Rhizobiales bacterium 65-9]
MNGIRRHGFAAALILSWMLTLGNLLGGLALARTLPVAHAEALAAATLCLPGDGDFADHASHHAAGCALCPGAAHVHQILAPPPEAALSAAVLRKEREADFVRPLNLNVASCADGAAQARGPPQA